MRFAVSAASLCALLLAGCSTCELVEAELRHQTNRLVELEGELDAKNREIAALRASLEDAPPRVVPPDATGALEADSCPTPLPDPPRRGEGDVTPSPRCDIERVTLGVATGGRDRDRDGCDESLHVVLIPLDTEGDARKTPGAARITVYESAAAQSDEPLASWEVPAEQLRLTWRSGLFGQGYHLVLPWQPPTSDSVRVCAAFTTVGGSELTAERNCRVKPGVRQRIVPPRPNVTSAQPEPTAAVKSAPTIGATPSASLGDGDTDNNAVDAADSNVASEATQTDVEDAIPPPPPLRAPPSLPESLPSAPIDWIILPRPDDRGK